MASPRVALSPQLKAQLRAPERGGGATPQAQSQRGAQGPKEGSQKCPGILENIGTYYVKEASMQSLVLAFPHL